MTDDKTNYGFPEMHFGKTKHPIRLGRILRFLAGLVGIPLALFFDLIEPKDYKELGMWLLFAAALIDRKLPEALHQRYRERKNGG